MPVKLCDLCTKMFYVNIVSQLVKKKEESNVQNSRKLILTALLITCALASSASYLCGVPDETSNVYTYNVWPVVSLFLIALWLRLDLRETRYP